MNGLKIGDRVRVIIALTMSLMIILAVIKGNGAEKTGIVGI